MKAKIIYMLAKGVMLAIIIALIGEYVVATRQSWATGQPVDISSDVMTLVQTALGGVIGIIGVYFGAKSKDE